MPPFYPLSGLLSRCLLRRASIPPEEGQSQFAIFLDVLSPARRWIRAGILRKILAALRGGAGVSTRPRRSHPARSSPGRSPADVQRRFASPRAYRAEDVGENWADGAVRFLLTPAEREE